MATRRARVTRLRAILSAQARKAVTVRSMAASDNMPLAAKPSPRRVMREKASTTRNPSWVGRATSMRQLLVPKSKAA